MFEVLIVVLIKVLAVLVLVFYGLLLVQRDCLFEVSQCILEVQQVHLRQCLASENLGEVRVQIQCLIAVFDGLGVILETQVTCRPVSEVTGIISIESDCFRVRGDRICVVFGFEVIVALLFILVGCLRHQI
jgi:hypothetical protein